MRNAVIWILFIFIAVLAFQNQKLSRSLNEINNQVSVQGSVNRALLSRMETQSLPTTPTTTANPAVTASTTNPGTAGSSSTNPGMTATTSAYTAGNSNAPNTGAPGSNPPSSASSTQLAQQAAGPNHNNAILGASPNTTTDTTTDSITQTYSSANAANGNLANGNAASPSPSRLNPETMAQIQELQRKIHELDTTSVDQQIVSTQNEIAGLNQQLQNLQNTQSAATSSVASQAQLQQSVNQQTMDQLDRQIGSLQHDLQTAQLTTGILMPGYTISAADPTGPTMRSMQIQTQLQQLQQQRSEVAQATLNQSAQVAQEVQNTQAQNESQKSQIMNRIDFLKQDLVWLDSERNHNRDTIRVYQQQIRDLEQRQQ